MATIRLLFCIAGFALTGSYSLFTGYLLRDTELSRQAQVVSDMACRSKLMALASAEVGVREKTGNNDGNRVEEYLSLMHLHRGDPYCAAFVSFIFAKEGFSKPRSGWSPDLFPSSRITQSWLPANVIGIYFPSLGRIGHVGLIERRQNELCVTIEGNTNVNGSREGQGVYRRIRKVKTIYRVADWVSAGRRLP